MRRSRLRGLKTLAKFSFAFLIIGYMIYTDRLDLAVVREGFSRWWVVAGCLALMSFSTLLSFLRWRLLLRGLGLRFSVKAVLRYGLIGAFFNTTMPGAVSGDIIKAWYVLGDHRDQEKTPVLASILLDRAMGVFGLVLVSVSALIFQWQAAWYTDKLHAIAVFVLFLAAGVVGFFLYLAFSVWGPLAYLRQRLEAIRGRRIGEIVLKAYDAWMSYRDSPRILLYALLLAVMTHICVVGAAMLCAHALGETHLSAYQFFLLVPMGLLTTAIPVAPAGLGVGHVAFARLFGAAGSTLGAEIFTLFITVQILINLSGVFFYLKSPKLRGPH